ncbi:hypothetical protein QD228_05560 [Cobetia sp. 3AK]|uniref:hypothetical protein n=1 Tax=Cobetia sp. 3AK TaxID=3040020 RepID=UPI00244CF9A3|nr:hypothetical protein [Cobetia sp. 3AK]MDH2373301.1 hypothetical protein [Cobetia sp. 3AK]
MTNISDKDTKIRLLDLNRKTSSELIEEKDLQKDLWMNLVKLLKPSESLGENNKDEFTPKSLRISQDRVHEAIFIGGRRGEGKTTILLQVLGKIERGEWPNYRSLGLLDPTLLETKQNLILSIVQRIREYLIHEEDSWGKRSRGSEQKLQKAREALKVLAKGITVLDGIGKDVHDEDWSEASFILDEGMERAEAAYGFEEGFRNFVSCAAEAVGCEAFVLCIDDVDTKSEMGGPVLEALRKYLTSPKLRVIVSGDPELLQSLTRKLQLEGLGKNFFDFEHSISKSYPEHSRVGMLLEQLSGLEDQFLTKVMPPNRRLKLKTLNEIDARPDTKIMLRQRHAKEEVPLKKFLKKIIIHHWGEHNPSALHHYRSAILSMPVRSIIEFLNVWDVEDNSSPYAEDVTARMIEIARSQLSEVGLRIDSIQNIPTPEMKIRRIVEWMCQEPIRWTDFSNLVPNGAHEGHDRVVLALSSLMSGGMLDKLSGIIRFWLLFALLKDQIELGTFGDNDKLKHNLLRFLAHTRYMQDQPIGNMLGYWAGWTRSPAESNQSGILMDLTIVGIPVATDRVRNPNRAIKRLYGVEYTSGSGWNPFKRKTVKEIDSFIETLPEDLASFHKKLSVNRSVYGRTQNTLSGALYNSVEGLAKNLDSTAGSALLLPYTKVSSPQRFEYGNYSLLSVFAGVIDLLIVKDCPRVMKGWQKNNTFPIVRNSRAEISAENDLLEQDGYENNEYTFSDQDSEDDFDADFVKKLEFWSAYDAISGEISSSLLMSIWKKFTSAVPRLFENGNAGTKNLINRNIFLGRFFHRQVIIFLHAFGVELYLREGGQIKVSLQSSPTNSDKIFLDLLTHFSSSKILYEEEINNSGKSFKDTPGGELFYHVLEFPMWAYYLESKSYNEIKTYFRDEGAGAVIPEISYMPNGIGKGDEIKFNSLYLLLNTIVMSEEYKP